MELRAIGIESHYFKECKDENNVFPFFQEFTGWQIYVSNFQAPMLGAIQGPRKIQVWSDSALHTQRTDLGRHDCLFHLNKAYSSFQAYLKSPLFHKVFLTRPQIL